MTVIDLGVAIAVLLVFPVIVAAIHRFSAPCTTSSAEAVRAILAWWGATLLIVLLVYIFFRMPLARVFRRVAAAMAFVVFVGLALPSLDFGSLDRSRQKRSMADIRSIAFVIEEHRSRTGSYPTAVSVADLQAYGKHPLPFTDAWGNRYLVRSSPDSYSITSFGLCGQPDMLPASGEITVVSGDIRFANGRFITFPTGMKPE